MSKHKSLSVAPDKIFVTELETGPRKTKGGIITPDDNMTVQGVRPRWCQVWRVGSKVSSVEPGDWILVEHGRWSQGIPLDLEDGEIKVWHVDPEAIMIKSKTDLRETSFTTL